MSTNRCKRCSHDKNYDYIRAEKTLAEDLDYSIDYAKTFALVTPTDAIQTSTWTVSSNGTLGSDSTSGSTATAWVSGGVKLGNIVRLTNTIVTTGGRTHVRLIVIKIVNRLAEVPLVEVEDVVA